MRISKTALIGRNDWIGDDYARAQAADVVNEYKQHVGDLDFGKPIAERLFVNYLAETASGNDTMRGYFAAFNRRPMA
jgi:hypothetical protein